MKECDILWWGSKHTLTPTTYFITLMLWPYVGRHEGHPAYKKDECWYVGGDDDLTDFHVLWLRLSPPPPSPLTLIKMETFWYRPTQVYLEKWPLHIIKVTRQPTPRIYTPVRSTMSETAWCLVGAVQRQWQPVKVLFGFPVFFTASSVPCLCSGRRIFCLLFFLLPKASPIPKARKQEISFFAHQK